MNQLRNMMFKSFTHEIKTPLNGVIQSMDLTQSILQTMKHKKKLKGENFREYDQVNVLLKQISSGVYIL